MPAETIEIQQNKKKMRELSRELGLEKLQDKRRNKQSGSCRSWGSILMAATEQKLKGYFILCCG